MNSYISIENRKRVDELITLIGNYKYLTERRMKKKPILGKYSVQFIKMINKCFELLDGDIDRISRERGIDRTPMTDYGLASTDTLHSVEEIYLSARKVAEQILSKRSLLRLTEGGRAVHLGKHGSGGHIEYRATNEGRVW